MKLTKTLLTATGIAALLASTSVFAGTVDSYTYDSSKSRTYKVYVPSTYQQGQAVPMVMALHGCAMDNTDAINLWDFQQVADANNFIVVYPFVGTFSEMRSTNCWGYWFDTHVKRNAGGEVDYLKAVGVQVESNYSIDPERRYITGISSGGAMTVAAAIAYNDYWAAAAPTAPVAYGDGSSSVTSELFENTAFHVNKLTTEMNKNNSWRAVPMMTLHSRNDTTVLPTGSQLIRDSQLTVWGADLVADSTEACDAPAATPNCVVTTYNGADGKPLVKTLYYDGVPSHAASLGQGHYWGGNISNPTKWTDIGPHYASIAWSFFENITFSGGYEDPACAIDFTAPATPALAGVQSVGDLNAMLQITPPNSEADLRGYKVYRANTGALLSSSLSLTGLYPNKAYSVAVTAVDKCGNESGFSNLVQFNTLALQYTPPTQTATCTNHYLANRLNSTGYTACGTAYGYVNTVVMYQLQDGTWTYNNPLAYLSIPEDEGTGSPIVPGTTPDPVPEPDPVDPPPAANTAPVVALNGSASVTLAFGAAFSDAGATATDAEDGALSVVVSGSVNTQAAGTYTLTYTATDSGGLSAAVTRTVVVNAAPVNTAPVVTLSGSASMTLAFGAAFSDPGATATDTQDGSLSVAVSGSVNTQVAGTYTLTYSATDSGGLSDSKTRTVVVNAQAPACAQYSGYVTTHYSAGRATRTYSWYTYTYYAKGSSTSLGTNAYATVILKTTDNGASYQVGACQ